MSAPWKKEIGACAWTKSGNVRERNGVRGAEGEGEAVGEAGVVEEEVSTMIVVDVLEIVVGAAGAGAPGLRHDPGLGHPEDAVPLLVNPLLAQGVPDPALLVLPEGIAPRDGTRGHTRGLALPHPADGSAPSPLHHPVNVHRLVARGVIVAVHLPAKGGTRRMSDLGHAVEALVMDRVGVVGPLPLRDAEGRASLDLLHRKAGGAEGARAIVAAAHAVNPPVMEAAWTSIVGA